VLYDVISESPFKLRHIDNYHVLFLLLHKPNINAAQVAKAAAKSAVILIF